MKTVIVFLILALTAWNAKAALDVEKPVVTGENYQHQLVCQALSDAAGESFHVSVKWKATHSANGGRAPYTHYAFSYEILNAQNGQTWSGDYADFFNESATVVNGETLQFNGNFFMYKRLGTLSRSAFLEFAKPNGGTYQLQKILLTARETYENPIYECEPMSKHCDFGTVAPKEKVLELEFSDSQCEYNAL